MFLLRCAFWVALVSCVVPYSKVDWPNATFTLDGKAIMAELEQLPSYCTRHQVTCEKAKSLALVIADQSVTAAKTVIERVKANS